jgi:hypothetical protein
VTLQPHNPFVIEDVMLTLGTKEFTTACDSVSLVPTTAKLRWKPVNGKKTTIVAKPDWALTLNVGQDFDTEGLMHELIEGHGETRTFKLQPLGSGDLAKIEGTVTLEAVQVGGGAETIAVSGVTLDVEGQPVFTWSAAE